MKRLVRCVFVFVSVSLLPILVHSQEVSRWDVCEDTTTMQYSGPALGAHPRTFIAAASPTDIAQIGLPLWKNTFSKIVRHTTDSGRTWNVIFSKKFNWERWMGLTHATPNTYVINGDTEHYLGMDQNYNDYDEYNAYLIVSNDAGKTWTQHYFDSNTVIQSVAMLTDNYSAAIVGHAGNIYNSLPNTLSDDLLITSDGWKTWTARPFPQGSGGNQQLICFRQGVFGVRTRDRYVNGRDSNDYLKTTDEGKTWQKTGSMPFVWDLSFINERLGWGAGTNWSIKPQQPLVIRTTDSGATWQTVLDSNMSLMHWGEGLSQVAFLDSLTGFAAGSRILETTDGGTTWSSNQPPYDLWSRPNGGGFDVDGLIGIGPRFAMAVCGSPVIRYSGAVRLLPPILKFLDTSAYPIAPVTITWSPVYGASSYRLQLAVDLPWRGSAQKIFDVLESDTTVRDTFFTFVPRAGESYFGRIKALGEATESDWRWSGDWYQLSGLFRTVSENAEITGREQVVPTDVYPNPATDFVHVKFASETPSISLSDMLGHSWSVNIEREENGLQLDVRNLPSGMYTVKEKPSLRVVVLH
jgi:photosystem II stability/assembly factor-like uncharacterized protein